MCTISVSHVRSRGSSHPSAHLIPIRGLIHEAQIRAEADHVFLVVIDRRGVDLYEISVSHIFSECLVCQLRGDEEMLWARRVNSYRICMMENDISGFVWG